MTPEPAAGLLPRLIDRFRHLLRELGKFGVVGGLAFLVDLAVFNLLLEPAGWLAANVASMTIAATAAFLGNRYWTWRDRESSSLPREYALYFFFNAVGLGITLAVLWFSHEVLGGVWPEIFHTRLADNVSKMLIGNAIATVFRFWAYRRFVFTGPRVELPQPAPAQASAR
ncbi:GtrA family protein [Catellatospora tritici]|uniref:GtrA family protein n=1 Tax=Catellatospora tritici TaxID=2851566 RepID=UPI001C2D6420|nr:GtrA family protein [Catellatospora tritici]MBV1849098.1 GtrA family protein [Catellatospora tritici]